MCVYVHVCVLMLCRPDASLNHFSTSFLQSVFLLLLLIIIIIMEAVLGWGMYVYE